MSLGTQIVSMLISLFEYSIIVDQIWSSAGKKLQSTSFGKFKLSHRKPCPALHSVAMSFFRPEC